MCNGEATKNLDHQLSATSTDGDSRDGNRLLHWTAHAGKMNYKDYMYHYGFRFTVCLYY